MVQGELPSIPRHVAIIMDGNGRWANERGLPRTVGHSKGVEAVRRTVEAAGDAGIEFLTLFAFSSENWSRPQEEVSVLMGLLRRFIRRDLAELHRSNVRIRVIGERDGLQGDILPLLLEAEETTGNNTGLTLIIAFNYGARDEIARAVRRLSVEVEAGRLKAADVTPDLIAAHLDTAGIPDPDLIIRTSGEERLSNFLLWQAAYSEFVFVPQYWPDFDRDLFYEAIRTFSARDRRLGGLSPVAPAAVAG
jgi:undecaprenyl diphosphate synthase